MPYHFYFYIWIKPFYFFYNTCPPITNLAKYDCFYVTIYNRFCNFVLFYKHIKIT